MESAATIEIAKQTLLSIGIILAVGAFCGFLAQKIRVPDMTTVLMQTSTTKLLAKKLGLLVES